MKILIVEDEAKVRVFLKKGLSGAEFTVDAVSNLQEAFSLLLSTRYEVIILDRLLKGIDSLKYVRSIKEKSPDSGVLILSALSDVDDKVEGLDEGADDYLEKPFHISELMARIRALSRRKEKKLTNLLTFEDLQVRLDSQKVERRGKRIDLTAKEYKLLVLLLKRPNRIYSRAELLDRVWEMEHYPESNVVEVAINHLRSKIDKGFNQPLIQSKRGIGYWIGSADL